MGHAQGKIFSAYAYNEVRPAEFNYVDCRPKTLNILICTANVFGFQSKHASKIFECIKNIRKDTDDCVILGFQEVNHFDKSRFENNLPEFRICAPWKEKQFCFNTLAFFSKKISNVSWRHVKLPYFPRTPLRFAVMAEFGGLKLANTHLIGGKYDDKHWLRFEDGREKQISAIIDENADIIIGDFNADCQTNFPLVKYWEKLLGNKRNLPKLLRYLNGVHQYLSERNYESAVERNKIHSTTAFNNVADWIYLKKSLKYKIKEWGEIPAISLEMSDHNFLWVRLEIEATERQ